MIRVLLATFLFAAFLLVTLSSAIAAPGDAVISGRLSLPDEDKVGNTDMDITITATLRALQGSQDAGQSYNTTVVIPAGQSSVSYSLSVPKPDEGFGYVVSYDFIYNRVVTSKYMHTGYYSDSFPGHSTQSATAAVLDLSGGGDLSGIDFTVAKCRSISGVLVLPDGMTAPAGGLQVQIMAMSGNPEQMSPAAEPFIITVPAGARSCAFTLDGLYPNNFLNTWTTDDDADNGAYRLMYLAAGASEYRYQGQYGQTKTVGNFIDAAKISLMDGDVTGIIFPLVSAQGKQAAPNANEIAVYLNGRALDFDVPPVIVDGRTLVPVRAIFEAMGLTVGWDEATRTVTGTREDTTIKLVIDSADAWVNGEPTRLDVPAAIIDGRTLVPLRFISESLGAGVAWNDSWRAVVISGD